MTRVLSVAGELGREVSDGGAGDQQAERMLLLLAKTGRRVMEILQLDFDPLLPLASGVRQRHRRVRRQAALPADQD